MGLPWAMSRCGVVVSLAALCGASAGCSGCEEPAVSVDGGAAKVVARLSASNGEVSHRAAQTIRWRAADKGLALRHRDAVKTGAGATARVRFLEGGGRLEIGERALVVIEAPTPAVTTGSGAPVASEGHAPQKPSAVARVDKGVVRGEIEPGGAPFTVRTADGRQARIVAEGGKARFRVAVKDDGKLEVAVLKGGARLEVGGKTQRLGGGEVVSVEGRQISRPKRLLPYPELVAPTVDARLHAGARLQLAWKPVPGAALYRVQVSPSLGFARREVDAKVTVATFVLPELRAGRAYVWRVSSVDPAGHEGEFGFARRFHVLSAAKERVGLLSPADNTGIQYVKQVRPVTFRWKAPAGPFELVVCRDRRLRRVVIRRRTDAHEARVLKLRRGVYYWGVFALDGDKRRPLHDKPHRLVVAKRLPPGVQVPKSIDWR